MSRRGHDIPYGYCECGCGEKTRLAPFSYRKRGWVKGQPIRFINGHYIASIRGQHAGYVIEDHGYLTPCWMWQGGKQGDGYGRMSVDGVNVPAHRAYYEERYGPVPEGLQLDHLCRVPGCVNPDHLEPVTFRVNRRRSIQTLLCESQVVEIKRVLQPHIARGRVPDGLYAELAARYGVAKGTIRSIRKGGSWADVRI